MDPIPVRLSHALLGAALLTLSATGQAGSQGTFVGEIPADPAGEVCLFQTTVTRGLAPHANVTLQHMVVVPPEHQGRSGDLFVGLVQEGVALPAVVPEPYAHYDALPAIVQLKFSASEEQLDGLTGVAALMVGYGLRGEGAAVSAYEEMLAAQRYQAVWNTGTPVERGEMELCFSVSRIAGYTVNAPAADPQKAEAPRSRGKSM